MEIFLGILFGLYVAVSLLMVIVGGLVLCLDEQYYTMKYVLTDKRDFMGCIFGFQMFVWDIAKDYHINIFGAILMEIFITAETDKTARVPINNHTYLPLVQTLFTRMSIPNSANADTAINGEIHSSFAVSMT